MRDGGGERKSGKTGSVGGSTGGGGGGVGGRWELSKVRWNDLSAAGKEVTGGSRHEEKELYQERRR